MDLVVYLLLIVFAMILLVYTRAGGGHLPRHRDVLQQIELSHDERAARELVPLWQAAQRRARRDGIGVCHTRPPARA